LYFIFPISGPFCTVKGKKEGRNREEREKKEGRKKEKKRGKVGEGGEGVGRGGVQFDGLV